MDGVATLSAGAIFDINFCALQVLGDRVDGISGMVRHLRVALSFIPLGDYGLCAGALWLYLCPSLCNSARHSASGKFCS